ncbi:MAG TPA: rod shape-determining protein MreC, partial [Gemmatimonadales bacterium]
MPRTAVSQGGRADAVMAMILAVLALAGLVVPAKVRDPVAAAVRRSVGVPLVALQERAERTRMSFLAHDSTSRIIDSLALRTSDISALEAENERLRALLGLGARVRWGFLVTDASPGTPDGGFVSADALGDRSLGREVTLTLDVGSRSGVAPYLPVVAPAGLVGRVRTVDPTTSLVTLYSHEDFRASAMTSDQRVVGIVRPHLGDEGDYLLEMGGVEVRNQLEPGTVIYTSGLGGTFPAYIPVGVVLRELDRDALWERTYLLRPMVRPGDIRSVLVLLPERVQAGLAGVWVAAPDSAAAAVAAVGDSIRADSARADSVRRVMAIQQRLLDSLRSAGVQLVQPADTADRAPATEPGAGAGARSPRAT